MLNALYIILALAAAGVACYYAFFYEASTQGGQYHYTYAGLALTAAVIFGALWLAGKINKDERGTKLITWLCLE